MAAAESERMNHEDTKIAKGTSDLLTLRDLQRASWSTTPAFAMPISHLHAARSDSNDSPLAANSTCIAFR